MQKREYALITFKSTHYAIQAEEALEEEDMDFKTIPTPREVSHSCGLSILTSVDDIEKIKKVIEEGKISIDGFYRFTKDGSNSKAEVINR